MKENASAVLREFGLTVSDVIRITLTRVANEGALPFSLDTPNATTRAAMEEARAMARDRARFETADELLNDLEEGNER